MSIYGIIFFAMLIIDLKSEEVKKHVYKRKSEMSINYYSYNLNRYNFVELFELLLDCDDLSRIHARSDKYNLFESPGISILQRSHRALEEAIFTDKQNNFKPLIGKRWVELVYGGFYFDPLTKNLENFLEDIQKPVTGKVTVLLTAGKVEAVAVDSKKILVSKDAVYAQSASWGVEESAGFIKLLGKSTSTWTEINKK